MAVSSKRRNKLILLSILIDPKQAPALQSARTFFDIVLTQDKQKEGNLKANRT
jgi:hypothetical protein